MQKFSGESYRHAAARHVFAQWLRNESTYDNYRGAFGLTWRANRGAPYFGVLEEVPIVMGRNCGPYEFVYAPDECGLTHDDGSPLTHDEMKAMGVHPAAILDIGILHKGQVIYGIEIYAKHRVPDRKQDFLRQLDAEVFEVDATWVLGQVEQPLDIPGWAVRRLSQ